MDKAKKTVRKKQRRIYPNSIWNRERMKNWARLSDCPLWERIRGVGQNIVWSMQRIKRGYSDYDVWNMDHYLQRLIPDMLLNLKKNRHGSPHLDEDDDACHAKWDKTLNKMIFLWRESNEETCSMKNPYEEEYFRCFEEFEKKYGTWGEKLRTKKELSSEKKTGLSTMRFMDEVPEYKDIHEKYRTEQERLDKYRHKCWSEAMDMLKEWYWDLWD